MLGAISTALSGLNAFNQGPQTISDNTANLDTLGAKALAASFEEVFNAGAKPDHIIRQPTLPASPPVTHPGDGAGKDHRLHDGGCGVGHVLGWRGVNRHPPAGFEWPDGALSRVNPSTVE